MSQALGPAAEYPIAGPVADGWCENYALVAHDPAAGVHLIHCTGCEPSDLALWHEYLLCALPDGTTIAWRSAGRGADPRGPGGALTRLRCEAPGETWELTVAGYGRRVPTAALDAGGLVDGPWTALGITLRFDALGPAWQLSGEDLARAGETSPFHYEQAGRVSGTVTVGADVHRLAGTGHRDHSRGPRDYASVLDHAWIDGQLADGRWFAAYRMRLADGSEGVAAGCLGDASTARPARVLAAPLLAEDDSDAYELVLECDGTRHVIEASIVTPLGTTSYLTPNGMAAGRVTDSAVTQHVRDGATRFRCDGVAGFGHTQRSAAPPGRGPIGGE